MGDPKKPRKKYQTPSHPWKRVRIESEKVITKDYGLKNKREIWKMESMLKKFKKLAKKSIVATTKQVEIEKRGLINKLNKLGLIKENALIDDILSLQLKDICERRLQTLVFRKNLARTVNQARQFIVHRHISIGEKKITSPCYMVSVNEEPLIKFSPLSNLANEEHPERQLTEKKK